MMTENSRVSVLTKYGDIISCPLCNNKDFSKCGCYYTDYIGYIVDLENKNIESEYEISKLNYIIKTLREDIDY